MTARNRHGLSRDIPRDVARQVRKECGFGCVVCGAGIYEYDHFAPEFVDARTHDPAGIALLCCQCHGRKEHKTLSTAEIAERRRRPRCLESGFAKEWFGDRSLNPVIVIGGARCEGGFGLAVAGHGPVILTVPNPEPGLPVLVSCAFFDDGGRPMLLVRDNVMHVRSSIFDVEFVGGRLTVRDAPGSIPLAIEFRANELHVQRLQALVGGVKFVAHEGKGWSAAIPTRQSPTVRFEAGSRLDGDFLVTVGPKGGSEILRLSDLTAHRQAFLARIARWGPRESKWHRLTQRAGGVWELTRTDGTVVDGFSEMIRGLLCLGSPPSSNGAAFWAGHD